MADTALMRKKIFKKNPFSIVQIVYNWWN